MRCNNHKCVQTPLWRGYFDLTVVGLPYLKICTCLNLSLVAHFGTSALLAPEIWKFLTPPPHTFISFMLYFHHTYFIMPSHSRHVFSDRRNHLRFFRLGLTRVLLLFSVWRVIWFPYPVVTVEPIHIKIYRLIEDQILDSRFLKRILSPWEDSNTLDGGHEPKNPTHILVREKKCAPPACLWLSNPFDDTCSDCYMFVYLFAVLLYQTREWCNGNGGRKNGGGVMDDLTSRPRGKMVWDAKRQHSELWERVRKFWSFSLKSQPFWSTDPLIVSLKGREGYNIEKW